jgi:hypothetical protein
MKTLKNKLYAVVLLICGYLPVLIDKDATALVFFAFIAIPLFFSPKLQLLLWKTMLFERSKRSMDEMKIGSKFTTSIISKLASLAIRKKFGYDVKLNLNEVKATVVDGKTHVHLDIDADLEKDELTKILKSIGL